MTIMGRFHDGHNVRTTCIAKGSKSYSSKLFGIPNFTLLVPILVKPIPTIGTANRSWLGIMGE